MQTVTCSGANTLLHVHYRSETHRHAHGTTHSEVLRLHLALSILLRIKSALHISRKLNASSRGAGGSSAADTVSSRTSRETRRKRVEFSGVLAGRCVHKQI